MIFNNKLKNQVSQRYTQKTIWGVGEGIPTNNGGGGVGLQGVMLLVFLLYFANL